MTTDDRMLSESEQRKPERERRVPNGYEAKPKIRLIQIELERRQGESEGIRIA